METFKFMQIRLFSKDLRLFKQISIACSSDKNIVANFRYKTSFTVPAVSNRQLNMNTRTTYEREYVDMFDHAPGDVRELGRHYGGQSLKKYNTDSNNGDGKLFYVVQKKGCICQYHGIRNPTTLVS